MNKVVLACIAIGTFLLIFSVSVSAQNKKKPVYSVSFLPRKAGYNADSLNSELSAVSTREDARKIITAKKFVACKIVIREERAGFPVAWWFINTGDHSEFYHDFAVARSKGIANSTVSRLGDFRKIVYDTLLIIDTVKIAVQLQEAGYRDAGFTMSLTCPDGKLQQINTPEQPVILLYPHMLPCEPGYTFFSIASTYNPSRNLASAVLKTMTAEEDSVLFAIARDYRNQHLNEKKEIFASFTEDVMMTLYGRPFNNGVRKWMAGKGLVEN